MLTDHAISEIALQVGCTEDDDGALVHRLARAIEQAATAPLLARIAELEAELEKTKAIFAASCNHAAVMEMERDARRYRWLRKGESDDVAVVRGLGAMDYGMSAVAYTYSEEIDGDDLDAAIDAAIAKAEGTTP